MSFLRLHPGQLSGYLQAFNEEVAPIKGAAPAVRLQRERQKKIKDRWKKTGWEVTEELGLFIKVAATE